MRSFHLTTSARLRCMTALLLALLTATPDCEAHWAKVWLAYEATELKGRPPFFEKFPDGKARLARAWVDQCRAFSKQTHDCLSGVTVEKELAELDAQLIKEGVPAAERAKGLARLRAEWSVLECREANRALDRAAEAVARELIADGGAR